MAIELRNKIWFWLPLIQLPYGLTSLVGGCTNWGEGVPNYL